MSQMTYLELDGVPINLEEMRIREFERRRHAWHTAKAMVDKLVEEHGLENLRAVSAPVFASPAVIGKAQQHSDLILEVAAWLMGEEG